MPNPAITATLVKLLRKLSGQENCYTIPKLYVELTKCHVRALILNQIVFYSDKSTRHEDGWFDKTYQEWEAETFVKERTLRNILKEFKERKWCDSKVELVNGVTTLCCKPYLENILSDIKTILDDDTPGKICRTPRKNLPNPPEKFAVPSYTDNNPDKNTDMCGENHTQSLSFEDYKKSELTGLDNNLTNANQYKMEREAFEDSANKALFQSKFKNRAVSYEDMFKACKEYYTQKNQWVGSQRFKQWITRDNPENYPQNDSRQGIKQNNPVKSIFSKEELEHLAEYKHWQRSQSHRMTIEAWIPNPEKRAKAIAAYKKELDLMSKDTNKNALASS